jgi:Putative zinc-finger
VSAHVRDRLSSYLDGELAAAARSEVESHLRGCAACARHLEELAAVDAAARELPVPAPPGYFESLPARVRARLPPPRRRSPPVWVWAAAAGIAVAALAPVLFQQAKAPVPEAARNPEPAPTAPALAIATVAPAREKPRAEAPADVPAAGLARDKLAAKDLGSIKLKASPAAAPPAAAQIQKHSGPWAQAPAGAPAPQPPATSDELQRSQTGRATARPDEAHADTAQVEEARDGVVTFAEAPTEQTRYRALLARRTASATEDRRLHDDWRVLAASYPTGAHADEARVRALDALLSAYRREGEARDRERLREEAGQYLQRADAAQAGRVRAILEAAGLRPEP